MKRSDLIWGGALIFVGSLFLLETLDIVNVNVWGVIWSVALIAAGSWILGWMTYSKDHTEAETISMGKSQGTPLLAAGGNGPASPAYDCVKPRLAFSLESPLDESGG